MLDSAPGRQPAAQQLQPAPAEQPADPGSMVQPPQQPPAAAPAAEAVQQLQLISLLQLTQLQQQQISLLQQQQRQQQPAQQQQAPPAATSAWQTVPQPATSTCQPALSSNTGPIPQQPAPPPVAQPAQLWRAVPAAAQPLGPPAPAAMPSAEALQLGGGPAEASPPFTAEFSAKHQYVQRWLEGAESEDQYSADPDHMAQSLPSERGGSSPAVVPVGLLSMPFVGGSPAPEGSATSPATALGQDSLGGGGDAAQALPLPGFQWSASAQLSAPLDTSDGPGESPVPKLQRTVADGQGRAAGSPGSEAAAAAASGASGPQPDAQEASSMQQEPLPAPALNSSPTAQQAHGSVSVQDLPGSAALQPASNSVASPQPPAGGRGSECSMSFEDFEGAEFSYSEQQQPPEQHTTTTLVGASGPDSQPTLPPAALPAAGQLPAAAPERPASPRQLARALSPPLLDSRSSSPTSPRPRPTNPHAQDDRYPTPPRSPHHASDSRPTSPTHAAAAADAAAAAGGARPDSPTGTSDGRCSPPRSPRASTVHVEQQQHQQLGNGLLPPVHPPRPPAPQQQAVAEDHQQQRQQAGQQHEAASAQPPAEFQAPPAQPEEQHCTEPPAPALPEEVTAASTAVPPPALGSPRVEDDTVVQSQAFAREYLGQVLEYFWQHRAAVYARGEQPLGGWAGWRAPGWRPRGSGAGRRGGAGRWAARDLSLNGSMRGASASPAPGAHSAHPTTNCELCRLRTFSPPTAQSWKGSCGWSGSGRRSATRSTSSTSFCLTRPTRRWRSITTGWALPV